MRLHVFGATSLLFICLTAVAVAAPTADILSHLEAGQPVTLVDHHDAHGGTVELKLADGRTLSATYAGAQFDTVMGWKTAAAKAGTPRAMTLGWSAKTKRVQLTDTASGTVLTLGGMSGLHAIDLAAEACAAKAKGHDAEMACKRATLAGWEKALDAAFTAAHLKESKAMIAARAGWTQFAGGLNSYVTTEMQDFERSGHYGDYLEHRIALTRTYTRLLMGSSDW